MIFATVTAVYLGQGNQPVVDCVDARGAMYDECRFLTPSFGEGSTVFAGISPSPEAITHATLSVGAEVVLVWVQGASGYAYPWVLSGNMRLADAARTVILTEAPDAGTDYTSQHVGDFAVRKGDAALNVSPLAGICLQSLETQPVRMQLGAPGLRISRNGASGETVLLGKRAYDHLVTAASEREALRVALVRLEDWASTANGAQTTPYGSYVGPGDVAPNEPFSPPDAGIKSAMLSVPDIGEGD